MKEEVTDSYQRKCEEFSSRSRYYSKKIRNSSYLRLTTFAAIICLLILSFPSWESWQFHWLALAGAAMGLFAFLVWRHEKLQQQRTRYQELHKMNKESIFRLHRHWQELPERKAPHLKFPEFATDLDLFGHASLYQLLGTAHTPSGKKTLGSWLCFPANKEEILHRQQAVQELAPQLDFRQDFEVQARLGKADKIAVAPFLNWLQEENWTASHRGLVKVSRGLLLLNIITLIATLAGVIPWLLWGGIIFLSFLFSLGTTAQLHRIFTRVSWGAKEIGYYKKLFALLDQASFQSKYLQEILQDLTVEETSAYQELKKLESIIQLCDLRYSHMLYHPIQALTLWDFHLIVRLENWKKEVHSQAHKWFVALGKCEALFALASLSHDHPKWAFPEIHEEKILQAQQLGHPLIAPDKRVDNDISVGPPGSFLLVTGSNMAGKSTLLRSLGLAIVLAQCGGPVCAKKLSLPLVHLATVMRVNDSLSDGVSYFMAELQRLKKVIESCPSSEKESSRILFFLLDEILQGTNNRERQIAVRRVLSFLLKKPAIGAISTHDLALAELEELKEASQPIHFKENIDVANQGQMSFDYKARPGIATTTNALKLLELVGLKLES